MAVRFLWIVYLLFEKIYLCLGVATCGNKTVETVFSPKSKLFRNIYSKRRIQNKTLHEIMQTQKGKQIFWNIHDTCFQGKHCNELDFS